MLLFIALILLFELSDGSSNSKLIQELAKYSTNESVDQFLKNHQISELKHDLTQAQNEVQEKKLTLDDRGQDLLASGDFSTFVSYFHFTPKNTKDEYIFIWDMQGSMRIYTTYCFLRDPKTKIFNLKWRNNENVTIINFNNEIHFLSIKTNFGNWQYGGLNLYKFSNHYLHNDYQITVKTIGYKSDTWENSFSKKLNLDNGDNFASLLTFEPTEFIGNAVTKFWKVLDEKDANFVRYSEKNCSDVIVGNSTMIFCKEIYETSVGYAPNCTKFHVFDTLGNRRNLFTKNTTQNALFSIDFTIKIFEETKYLIEYSYFDLNRSIDSSKLRIKIYLLQSEFNSKLVEDIVLEAKSEVLVQKFSAGSN